MPGTQVTSVNEDTTMPVLLDDPPQAIPLSGAAGASATCPSDEASPLVWIESGSSIRFEMTVEPVPGRLDLVGELDLAGAQRVRDISAAILAGASTEMVVDLAGVRFIDAAGIGVLIWLRTELAARGTSARLVNADSRVRRAFVLCGLEALMNPSGTT